MPDPSENPEVTSEQDKDTQSRNLEGFLNEYGKKRDSVNHPQIIRDFREAEKSDPDKLKKWDAARLARLFLDDQYDEKTKKVKPLHFKVNFRSEKFAKALNGENLFPPHVKKIRIVDEKGQTHVLLRGVNGRDGYFESGADKSWKFNTGNEVEIMEVLPPAKKPRPFRPGVEISAPNTVSAPVSTHPVPKERPPEVLKREESKKEEPKKAAKVKNEPEKNFELPGKRMEAGESVIETFPIGAGSVYINMPKDYSRFEGKKPQYFVYYHGNGGTRTQPEMEKYIATLRERGIPAILVFMGDAPGATGSNRWGDYFGNDVFENVMNRVKGITGQEFDHNISISCFSGGYIAMNYALEEVHRKRKGFGEHVVSAFNFDALYDGGHRLAQFAADDKSRKVGVYYTQYQELKKGPNRISNIDILAAASQKYGTPSNLQTIKYTGTGGHHGALADNFVPAMLG